MHLFFLPQHMSCLCVLLSAYPVFLSIPHIRKFGIAFSFSGTVRTPDFLNNPVFHAACPGRIQLSRDFSRQNYRICIDFFQYMCYFKSPPFSQSAVRSAVLMTAAGTYAFLASAAPEKPRQRVPTGPLFVVEHPRSDGCALHRYLKKGRICPW